MDRHAVEQQIAHDLNICDMGIAFTKGKTRKMHAAHRKACFDQIKRWNEEDGLNKRQSDEELLAELGVVY